MKALKGIKINNLIYENWEIEQNTFENIKFHIAFPSKMLLKHS